tara:strand:- start:62 stop:409 length:348 start_codon:yes stop_codon:yes gene_type:complete
MRSSGIMPVPVNLAAIYRSEKSIPIITTLDTMTDNTASTSQFYSIESIEPVEPPAGAEGSDWHQYVIVQGTNRISGYRQGSMDSVRRATEENIELLNERQFGKRARVQQSLSSKK